jgi:hypothetical protein
LLEQHRIADAIRQTLHFHLNLSVLSVLSSETTVSQTVNARSADIRLMRRSTVVRDGFVSFDSP